MEALTVIPISNIDAFIPSNRMWVNDRRSLNIMLPFLLHLRMHYKQRVVRQMYRNLSFGVCSLVLRAWLVVVISSNDLPYSKFAGYAETETANDGSGAEVGELIGVVAYAFIAAFVAVDECCVGFPFYG